MKCIEFKNTITKARKEYRCTWCGEIINKGEIHSYRAYKFDGFQTDRMHLECSEALNNFPYEEDWTYFPYSYKRGSIDEK